VRLGSFANSAALPLAPVLALSLALVAAGCTTDPTIVAMGGDEPFGHGAVAGEGKSIAVTNVPCSARTEDCAEAHAAKGDACLRLAIQQPQSASAKDSRVRELLDCAEEGYRKALERQPSKTSPSRISYHGGLLLTLSERRNRLDTVKEKKLDRENEKLLIAAQDARREVPGSALGYIYGASAHIYRAPLKPQGGDRCNDLRQAEAMLKRSPPPPRELAAEQERMQALTQRQLRENTCPRINRR
jgi:hypothetical protein